MQLEHAEAVDVDSDVHRAVRRGMDSPVLGGVQINTPLFYWHLERHLDNFLELYATGNHNPGTQFTCFTSTKVHRLTRLPTPPEHYVKGEHNPGAGAAAFVLVKPVLLYR